MPSLRDLGEVVCASVRRATRICRVDQSGATAIEFALVGLPFIMLLFGTLTLGIYFFTTLALENAVEQAARLIRTGQAQSANMTVQQFKDRVCNLAPAYIDCVGKMRINVQSSPNFSIAPPVCTDSTGNLIPPTDATFNPGTASQVVLVIVCYEFELAASMPFLKLGSMPNGSALIQAGAAFRSEPYGS